MAALRQSKFKHVFGKAARKDECYENIPITRNAHDASFCAVNPKYLAIITETGGGGGFTVIPISKVGRMPNVLPMVAGHTSAVLDIQWCPHNNDVIASASDDCTVKIWQIPEGGIGSEPLTESIATLIGHQRRVHIVVWHPTAQGVIASSGADNMLIIWNSLAQTQLIAVEFPNMITCLSFNYNGSKLASCCKDGVTRIVDPRSGKFITDGVCHEGKKPQMCVFLQDDRLLTTGFSKMSERQISLWDCDNLKDCLQQQEIDITNGVLFPYYDIDTQLIFICGKGDSTVRYFEYSPSENQVFYLNRFDSTDPQRGFAFMPKLGLNVAACEIARLYKLHNKNWCEVISFTVPRKSGLFQEDLYPDTISPVAPLTCEAWLNGENADPIKVSVREAGNVPASSFNVLPVPGVGRSVVTPSSRPLTSYGADMGFSHVECAKLIEQLTQTVDKLVEKVADLEERIAGLEAHGNRSKHRNHKKEDDNEEASENRSNDSHVAKRI